PQIPATLPFAAQGYELGGVGGSEIVTEAVEELDVLIEDDSLIVEAVGHGGVLPSGVWSVVGWIRVRRSLSRRTISAGCDEVFLGDFQDDERVVRFGRQRPRDHVQVMDVIANVVIDPACVLRAQSADD